ncbi:MULTISPECIES: HNH endonuclease [Bacillus mojavensis subgroup]|uniref:HNH endonuclease n=1 Tax=Bacillus mojavensis subgroup TaxID=653388 RepID=UPI002DB9B143|nr:HNH endonuclease [Bacillus mojavensis]MEC1289529.1 HNH endonuclease [Bacillus mojavensis]MEC1684264.1 HNH endonuclease [Bacillus mojavensis]MEC1704580.1 HNH endonuclease [Bacillus mojavensis]MEC1709467.1 HNH endonuclease [Bacillus mojavensis]MEC5246078.1 HNH endonuclease [Bacillus mojavensis]
MSEARRPHNKLDIDEDFIRKNYSSMTAKEIGEKLGVSREAINHRVIKMGLRKTQIPFVLMEGEVVSPLAEFPGYGITNHSRVINLKKKTVLKTKIDSQGYTKVILYKEGKQVGKRVHRLVALNFIPNPKNLPFVNHIDGNKANPKLSNLEWVTPKGNAQHALKHGLLLIGEKSPKAKITELQALSILNDFKSGKSIKELSEIYTYASKTIITKICLRQKWKHLDQTS